MEAGPRPPTVDEVTFRELYQKTEYAVDTADGWSLVITRYQPTRLPFFQPLWMEPLLLVHGFSQNRHAWTSGEFVKNLLYFGVDIHVLELRGHGKSSIARQRLLAERDGRPLPADLDYQWDVDSYLVEDVPAAVAAVKRMTGRPKIFYCGHSMGGMLGYGYAGQHDDLEGLITIGSASELGRGFPALRLLSMAEPALQHLVDAVLAGYNAERSRRHLTARLTAAARRRWNGTEPSDGNVLAAGVGQDAALSVPIPTRLPYVPVDVALHAMDWILGEATRRRAWAHAARGFSWLSNPTRTEPERIHWLLRNGGEREPAGGGGPVRALGAAQRDEVLPDRLRLPSGLREDPDPDGDHLRRPRPAGHDRLHPRRLSRGEERVPAVAAGEGQQPHRAHHGA